jgi:mRNA interferase RelE/StbE
MKPYQVILTPEAQADLRRMTSAVRERLLDKLEWMGENVELIRHQSMQGDEWKGSFKYRVGDYRIIYSLDHSAAKLFVLKAAHRREVYK